MRDTDELGLQSPDGRRVICQEFKAVAEVVARFYPTTAKIESVLTDFRTIGAILLDEREPRPSSILVWNCRIERTDYERAIVLTATVPAKTILFELDRLQGKPLVIGHDRDGKPISVTH